MRRHKYNAVPVVVDGLRFDSALEARRYQDLKLMEQAGEISDLEVHPRYSLLPKYLNEQGHIERAIRYEADFAYVEKGTLIVEEVKGFQTAVWRLKRRMFVQRYPELELRVIGGRR